jgi:hypothetical protein
MSTIRFCLIAALALLVAAAGAGAGDNTFPPPPGFGEPPPVEDFGGYPWLHPRMGYSYRIVPISRVCRTNLATNCWLRQYEPVGSDCGCPPTVNGRGATLGKVSRF